MGPSSRAWNEDYRTLGEGYPESVFCVDHKISAEKGAKKRNGREGAYEISIPLNASSIPTTNNCLGYPGNVTSGPHCISSYQTISSSPKQTRPLKLVSKPLMFSTIRPSDHLSLEVPNRIALKSTAYMAPDGRLISVEGTELYNFSEAYQTLDPSTFTKNSKKSKENSGLVEGAKVTFNVDMLPVAQTGERMESGEGFGRLLKNDILGEKDGGNVNGDLQKPVDDDRHDLVVYGKSANPSSFV
ncbi:unnamed protein product [Hydatigera taeniaeformis]|uniref:Mediator of RNA polymerase II transcription subunit 19 n=1 Tax=Hydatigena taeniaeformis TaxID=6205 RepID=A0A0R3X326_HYDTA|nr:unnamed protein product [Hydatigera taeniaeformis]